MPGEIEPALRLLQAVCHPGHGVLLHRGRVVLSSGDDVIVAALVICARHDDPIELAETIALDEAHHACIARANEHVLAVAMPRAIDVQAVHVRLARAIALYAPRLHAMPFGVGGSGSGGASGAPAELFLSARPRQPR